MAEDRIADHDWVVITCERKVGRSADEVWKKIGGFGALSAFLPVSCTMLAGDGGVGSVRLVLDRIVEPMVAATKRSYTYAQTKGPMEPFGYHGTLAVEPEDAASRIVYTLVYNQSSMDEPRRKAERESISARFTAVVEAMKAAVEARNT